jgi:hypothetical protein
MDEQLISRLEFKRKFILDNLERIKKSHDRSMDNSESVKKWVVTLWFGCIALSLKENWAADDRFLLSILIIIMFYLIDSYYMANAIKYSKRIGPIEQWIMSAKDEDILNLNTSLYEIGPIFNLKDRILCYFSAFMDKYLIIFYSILSCISFLLAYCFDIGK